MAFLYSFLTYLQPGILWPVLAPYRPIMIISLLGLLAGILSKSEYPRSQAYSHPAFVYLSLFILVQVLSVYYSGLGAMMETFLRWYQYLAYMIVAVLLIANADALVRYVWGMILGGMFIVCYGIYVAMTGLGHTVGGHAAGAYGMYENHNDYTYVIIVILPFIYMFWKGASGVRRLLLLAFLGLCIIGVFLSLSRAGILALCLEVLLLLVLAESGKRRVALVMLALMLSVSAITYQWATRDQYSSSTYTSDDAKESRIELWKAGWKMFVNNPVLGVGSERFGEYAKEYYELSHSQKGKNAHNTYVQVLATTGILGMLAFLLYIRHLIKSLRLETDKLSASIEAIRIAALASFLSLLFRAFTNAKPDEWGFYMLCVIGVTLAGLTTSAGHNVEQRAQRARS